MGYDEVILLGVDHSYGDQNQKKFMRPGGGFYESRRNDQLHFDKNYVADYTKVPINLFAMERAYEMAHAMFKGANRQIINASAGSKLDIFPRADFMSIL